MLIDNLNETLNILFQSTLVSVAENVENGIKSEFKTLVRTISEEIDAKNPPVSADDVSIISPETYSDLENNNMENAESDLLSKYMEDIEAKTDNNPLERDDSLMLSNPIITSEPQFYPLSNEYIIDKPDETFTSFANLPTNWNFMN